MSKVVAIAFSDLHLKKFQAFNVNNSRLKNSLKVLDIISDACKQYNVPAIFCGDLFHDPKDVENETMSLAQKRFHKRFEEKDIPFVAISGNHDFCDKNGWGYKSPSHLDSFTHFNKFVKLDYKSWECQDFKVFGIPYMNSDFDLARYLDLMRRTVDVKLPKLKILLLHSDAPGARNSAGITIDETENIPKDLDSFFKHWDLVLWGHIHSPQRLSKKCWMLGSPCHQNMGDKGDMGYWKVYSDGRMEFAPIDLPKFIQLQKGEKEKADGNYYIPYEVDVVETEVEAGEFDIKNSRDKLAKRYCALKKAKKAYRRALIEVLNQAE